VLEFQSTVTGVAMKVLKNSCDTEDVAQDTWMTVQRKIHQLRDPKRFPGWLRQTAWHMASAALRKKLVHKTVLESDAEWNYAWLSTIPAPSSEEADSEQAKQLRQCLVRLNPNDRNVLVEHYWNGLKLKEISKRDRKPIGTVKRELYQARQHLKKVLKVA
jgi:RNA polymerase sigma-70 factor (ECF subfamily)